MSKQNKHSGGGSNILRGGKRSYECGTLIGNFVEEAYRPGVAKSHGFTSSMYTTSTQLQQSGGVVKPSFGPALKNDVNPRYDYTNIVGPDTLHAPSTWVPASKSCDFHPRELKTATMSGPELEAYRQKWSKDQEGAKQLRFNTESVASQGVVVPAQFKPQQLRPDKNTPS